MRDVGGGRDWAGWGWDLDSVGGMVWAAMEGRVDWGDGMDGWMDGAVLACDTGQNSAYFPRSHRLHLLDGYGMELRCARVFWESGATALGAEQSATPAHCVMPCTRHAEAVHALDSSKRIVRSPCWVDLIASSAAGFRLGETGIAPRM